MLFSLLAIAVPAFASPILERQLTATGVDDTVILNYALTLEHLENVFYTDALNKYDAAAFAAAGFPDWVRNRFEQISGDEASHVAFLTSALGSAATQACEYSFPYTDPYSFTALAALIENVGVSAYLGAAAYISDPAYLTAAGAILTTEARHQAWIQSAVDKLNPWSSPYETPLKFGGILTLAEDSCPSTNPTFPFKPFPSLTSSSTTPGSNAQLTYTDDTTTEKYLIVYYGLSITAVPINQDKTVTIPSGLQGTSYAVVSSSSNTTVVAPSSIIAGPLILFNPFSSHATNPDSATDGQ